MKNEKEIPKWEKWEMKIKKLWKKSSQRLFPRVQPICGTEKVQAPPSNSQYPRPMPRPIRRLKYKGYVNEENWAPIYSYLASVFVKSEMLVPPSRPRGNSDREIFFTGMSERWFLCRMQKWFLALCIHREKTTCQTVGKIALWVTIITNMDANIWSR